jgi:hypothetical protein
MRHGAVSVSMMPKMSCQMMGMALLCAVAASAAPGFEEAGNDVYRVVMNHDPPPLLRVAAGFAIYTGPAHPVTTFVGRPAELIESGGRSCVTCTGDGGDLNFFVVRSYRSSRDYVLIANNFARLASTDTFECDRRIGLGNPSIDLLVAGGAATGLRATWRIDGAPDDLLIEHDLVVHGQDFVGSRVESTIRIRNVGSGSAEIGLRKVINPTIDSPAAPGWPLGRAPLSQFVVGLRPPDPPPTPYLDTEAEWALPGFRMHELKVSPTRTGDPDRYIIAGCVNGPSTLVPPITPPDLLQYGKLDTYGVDPAGGVADACFEWHVPEPPRLEAYIDYGSIVSYWGLRRDDAIVIPPGGEASFTQYHVAYREYPLAARSGGPYTASCEGSVTHVPVMGTVELTHPTSEAVHVRWSCIDPRVTFSDPTSAATEAVVAGVGRFAATFTVSIGAYESAEQTTITVEDVEPPRFSVLAATPSVLWQPNHRLVEVVVNAAVEDDCDPVPTLRLVSVRSSEPDLERGRGSGGTAGDVQGAEIGTADVRVLLRAERDGRGRGRTYTLTYEAEDWAGNVATQRVLVQVPHAQGRGR